MIPVAALGTTDLVLVMPPRDLGERPNRVITVAVAAGVNRCGLAAASVETGPTADGPWFSQSLGSSGFAALDAGENGVLTFTSYSRFLRMSLKAAVEAQKHCDLTIYLDAEE
jgi:hypothetical protein